MIAFVVGGRRIGPLAQAAAVVVLGVVVALATYSSPFLAIAIGGTAVFVALGLMSTDLYVGVAFATIAMPRLHPPGTPLPLNELLLGMMFVVLVISGRTAERKTPWWLAVTLGGLLGALAFSMFINNLFSYDASKRMGHIVLLALVLVCLANGYIPFRAAMQGLAVGTVIGIGFGILALLTNIGADTYTGRLTGYLLGEPNFAGLLIAAAGPVVVANTRRRDLRYLFVAVSFVGLVLTYSRTSYLAVALAGVWLVAGRRVKPGLGLVMLAAVVFAVTLLPSDVQTTGPFATRTGSDQLRSRIFDAEVVSIKQAPILGHGPSTATVELPGQAPFRFFFHSSYYALVQEGGAVALLIYVALLLTVFFRLTSLSSADRSPLLEASVIALMVCGVTLGEVLLEIVAAVAIGAAARHVLQHTHDDEDVPVDESAETTAGPLAIEA